jgi:hypothetical protein
LGKCASDQRDNLERESAIFAMRRRISSVLRSSRMIGPGRFTPFAKPSGNDRYLAQSAAGVGMPPGF